MHGRAKPELERAVAEDRADCGSWLCLALVREGEGDTQGCVAACEQVLLLEPEDPEALVVLEQARLASRAASRAECPTSRSPQQEQDPAGRKCTPVRGESVDILGLADGLLAAGKLVNAEKLYGRYVDTPRGARALVGLARCAAAQRQYALALAHLREVQRFAPDYPNLATLTDEMHAALKR